MINSFEGYVGEWLKREEPTGRVWKETDARDAERFVSGKPYFVAAATDRGEQ